MEKALGGAVGSSKLGSWKRTSGERGAGLGLPLGGRGGLLLEFCLLSPGSVPSHRLSSRHQNLQADFACQSCMM